MNIARSPSDQRVILMAARWCLDHGNGLIPDGGFTAWCAAHWKQLTTDTAMAILRDAIKMITISTEVVDDWERFVSWGLVNLDPYDRAELLQMLQGEARETLSRLLTNCGKCGFDHPHCICVESFP